MIQDVSCDLLVDSFRAALDWIPKVQERDEKKLQRSSGIGDG